MAKLKKAIKRVVPARWLGAWHAYRLLPQRVDLLEKQARLLAAASAHAGHPSLHDPARALAPWNRHELKVHSQNGEDGLLLHLFSVIGAGGRRFVEFGIGQGEECNTANLSLHFGWQGLLMDCGPGKAAAARAYYARRLGPRADGVRIIDARVTAENIDALLAEHAPWTPIDLLSIDIDGNDYWVWEAITAAPRVVVIEYNAVFGPERAVTTPYDPGFDRWAKHPSGLYFGASLAALTRLGARKGYRLAGCDSHGVNAFFVREDIAPEPLPAMTAAEAYFPLQDRLLGWIDAARYEEIAHLPLETV